MYRLITGFLLVLSFSLHIVNAQTPATLSSADIYLQMKKLNVLGSVLYIAAHPDDENTKLLAYLSKDRLYRTGYLSITRGDGGQNLIGDEQGVELGLIRTQELLAARRIDGAEQFFTRAYDFGFCKNTEEALQMWNEENTLSDLVWVIRQFRPDVIVTRFPEDSRAGHGHHSASAVLAHEAYKAAADPKRFPEQFKYGVQPWQAKRLLWNTFNFSSGNSTISEDQFKIDVGGYNTLLGKSYGEIAAESRSQHKSQGFGVATTRGKGLEYFKVTEGNEPEKELLDGVNCTWGRVDGASDIQQQVDAIIANYSFAQPAKSVPALVRLYQSVSKVNDEYWKNKKLAEIQQLIEACSGLYLEAVTAQGYVAQGDSLKVNILINNRSDVNAQLTGIVVDGVNIKDEQSLQENTNVTFAKTIFAPTNAPLTQPYWLAEPMSPGSFVVNDQRLIGKPQNGAAFEVNYTIQIDGQRFVFTRPVQYKYTDPVKGEVYAPLAIVPPYTVELVTPLNMLIQGNAKNTTQEIKYTVYKDINNLSLYQGKTALYQQSNGYKKGQQGSIYIKNSVLNSKNGTDQVQLYCEQGATPARMLKKIQYDHIPAITYFPPAVIKFVSADVKTVGKKIGYIRGAGDKVAEALMQMGYNVSFLNEKDLTEDNLKNYDAIVTGVRAYNIHEFLSGKYEVLMHYIENGGNLIVQYNTNSQIGPVKAKIAPYPFNISRVRVTDEHAKVSFLLPQHQSLNSPNKITEKDFEGWIQERSIYHADQLDSHFVAPLGMNDAGEPQSNGSLVIAPYGKGNFVYTGLVFFRELPAGVPGAYRLMANLIAL